MAYCFYATVGGFPERGSWSHRGQTIGPRRQCPDPSRKTLQCNISFVARPTMKLMRSMFKSLQRSLNHKNPRRFRAPSCKTEGRLMACRGFLPGWLICAGAYATAVWRPAPDLLGFRFPTCPFLKKIILDSENVWCFH
ncbi:unnamed protein product [Chondrus crispus]|uniref:Uncharacterized protein n=1 Tax=Chondrus crispus TaxID=2769 RepID=R7QC69_CHOCR|nr:unnamed protein product [Chondrus crispus]CDF34991.1 unnamed protein product [Chondrus crispus]|eukprot:XP_005714810.1 unnamed protein product [Chondrus crispus]